MFELARQNVADQRVFIGGGLIRLGPAKAAEVLEHDMNGEVKAGAARNKPRHRIER